jgi:hypothetical protein
MPETEKPPRVPNIARPLRDDGFYESVWLVVGYSQEPVMGGMRLMPPEPICLVHGDNLCRAKVNHLDQNHEPAHFGMEIVQPWVDNGPFEGFAPEVLMRQMDWN